MQVAQLPIPEAPKKMRSSRKPWSPERYETLAKSMAASAKAIGLSFVKPANPHDVPRDAPVDAEWNKVSSLILATIPTYHTLYDERKKLGSSEKSHNGGLDQFVYIRKEIVAFLNSSGVLKDHKFPVDPQSGLGIATRALLTSTLVGYAEAHGLKHPEDKKYIMRDAALATLITDKMLEELKVAQPKTIKKRKEGAPVKTKSPKVKMLDRNGQSVPHFSFDGIPILSGYFILDLAPRAITDAQKASIAATRAFLSVLTETRKEARKTTDKADREAKKANQIKSSIVPTSVMTLTINPMGLPQ